MHKPCGTWNNVLQRSVRRAADFAFLALLGTFAWLVLRDSGAIGFTWDEGSDLGIVSCLQRTHDPFACLDDVSQTRFPFYVHALAHSLRAQYAISAFFALLQLSVLYVFARREFGAGVALLASALYATCTLVLASARMILSHSNVIFSAFTLLSFVALYAFAKTRRFAWLAAAAVFSGLAAASHVLALFNGIAMAIFYAMACHPFRRRDALFVPIAAAAFFASTVIYAKPSIFAQLVDACLHPGAYGFWNVFGSGSPRAPWFFAFAIFAVKIGPWWLVLAALCAIAGQQRLPLLQRRFLTAFFAGLLIDFALKGAVFHYEAPHHQVQFYALACLGIAVLIAGATRARATIIALTAVAFAVQLYDDKCFTPNYIFDGAQYGNRFIGEFYGPAVIHAQDRGPLNAHVDALIARDPNVRIVVAEHNILERSGANFVVFPQRGGYAFCDYLYDVHFRFPERDAYNAWLGAHCTDDYTYFFPPHVPMYRVLRCR